MSELLHNLSFQALNFENKKRNIKFEEIIRLNKNIKRLIRDVSKPDIKPVKFEKAIDNTIDKVEVMEDEVVNNILTNKKIEFPTEFKPPMPNSLTEIENDFKKVKAIKRKTDESLNEIYGEITHDLVTKARNDLVKSVTDYEGDTPMEVINNITSSFKEQNPIRKSVSKHVRESIKDRNQQYFKQKKPVTKKIERNINPKLKITDIVNRGIVRSNSVTSIPLNDIEMLSRLASLDSIATLKHEYNDEEMISRPSSVASIRDSNRELSFRQPIKLIKPKATIDVKPKQPLIETANNKTNDKPLTAAVKALKNKEVKYVKSSVKPTDTPLSAAVRSLIEKKQKPKLAPKPINPPTISLSKSIDQKQIKKIVDAKQKKTTTTTTKQQEQIIKKKAATAKADIKTKQQEQVVKWRTKGEDVEMITPVVIGKRKKDVGLQSEAKTKKEN